MGGNRQLKNRRTPMGRRKGFDLGREEDDIVRSSMVARPGVSLALDYVWDT